MLRDRIVASSDISRVLASDGRRKVKETGRHQEREIFSVQSFNGRCVPGVGRTGCRERNWELQRPGGSPQGSSLWQTQR